MKFPLLHPSTATLLPKSVIGVCGIVQEVVLVTERKYKRGSEVTLVLCVLNWMLSYPDMFIL